MTSTHANLPAPGTGLPLDGTPPRVEREGPTVEVPTFPAALGAAARVERRFWLAGGAIVAGVLLLAAGVSASLLLTVGILGACLGMHLFMGHGGHTGSVHGDTGHAGLVEHPSEAAPPAHAGHVHAAPEADA